jgi:uncharacterized protein
MKKVNKLKIVLLVFTFLTINTIVMAKNKENTHKFTNALINEASPYLLQHAHNPVNWFAWKKSAFAKAKKEDKPIFLSIGYSTCHWCHVMERESFENEKIAKYLNENFIAIKVDREQHPVVDNNYMLAVMMLNGRGGWPASVFLTPDGLAFYAGTYYPPDVFLNVLKQINDNWKNKKPQVLLQTNKIKKAIKNYKGSQNINEELDKKIFYKTVNNIKNSFDDMQGGFSSAPKFPNEPILFFLLHQYQRENNPQILTMIDKTLLSMAKGGIYDHIGGGFARYSTDNDWLVPHFEKMLYNQAHLSRAYLLAYKITQNIKYKRVAIDILDYVIREMTDKNGGFYSATDADSEEIEGKFFVWSLQEIQEILPKDEAKLIIDYYNITKEGDFEGENILNVSVDDAEFAKKYNLTTEKFYQKLDKIILKIREVRNKRIKPFLDKKIITSWNAAMISSFVTGFMILQKKRYLKTAKKAYDFINTKHRDKQDNLQRMSLQKKTQTRATFEDYAYIGEASLYLYQATDNKKYLKDALKNTEKMIEKFYDKTSNKFFMAEQSLVVDIKPQLDDGFDNAIPSATSVAFNVLQKLTKMHDDFKYENIVRQILQSFTAKLNKNPSSFGYFLTALNNFNNGSVENIAYGAHGKIKIITRIDKNKAHIAVKLADNWHINSHIKQEGLIATVVEKINKKYANSENSVLKIDYPTPIFLNLAFAKRKISVYEKQADIVVTFKKPIKKPVNFKLKLSLQACSDETCLPPERIFLYL